MANEVYITAGLPVAKDSGQSPSSGVNTIYVTAGLPPEVDAGGGGGGANINLLRGKVRGGLLLGGKL